MLRPLVPKTPQRNLGLTLLFKLQERPGSVLCQNLQATKIQWSLITVDYSADSLLKPKPSPWRKTVFDPVSAYFLFALAKSMCTIQEELAPVYTSTTKFIYVKVNMTFPSSPSVIPFPPEFSCIPAVLPPMTPTNTAPKVLPGNMRLSKAWPTQKSPRMTPRLHPAITCPCVPSKAGDITAGTSPKSSLIIPTDFNVLQNHLEYLPNYYPDNGEWSQVPGILWPASPSHACSCLASEADCSMWRPPPHTPPLPSPPSSLPAPITTTPSMWIL